MEKIMTIYERIVHDKNQPDADRAMLSLIQGEICVDGKPMSDKDAIVRLGQMVKTCDKNVEIYSKARKTLRAQDEYHFRQLIRIYMPTPASEEDVEMTLAELNLPRTMKSMGPLMKELKSKFEVVDGNMVKALLMGEIPCQM